MPSPRTFRFLSRLAVAVYPRLPLFGDLCSSVGILRRGDLYLLQRRSDDLGWAFPGGTAWPWETAEQTLHRELLEETGLTLRHVRPLFQYHDRRFLPCRITVFAAEGIGEARGSWEGDVAWLPLATLRGPECFAPHTTIVAFLDAHPGVDLAPLPQPELAAGGSELP